MNHKLWLLLSLGISFIFGLSGFYSHLILNAKTPSLTFDEAIFYAPKVQEINEGHWWLTDPQIWEYRDSPSPFVGETLPAVIMAGLSQISGGIDQGFILADWLFPPLIFLLLTYFIYLNTKNYFWSPVAALITMFFSPLWDYFPYLPSTLRLVYENFVNGSYSDYLRSFHPQISFIIFLFFLIQLFKPKQKGLWLGLWLGLLTYTYLFYWILAWVWSIINRRSRVWLDLLVAGLIASPYFVNLIKFQLSPLSKNFIANSYHFSPINLQQVSLLVIGLILSLLAFKKREKWFWVSFFMAISSLIFAVSLTKVGIDDMIGHWLIRVIWPLLTLTLVIYLINRLKPKLPIFAISLSLLLIVYQGTAHRHYFRRLASATVQSPIRLEALKWLDLNTPKDSVVGTISLTDNLYLPFLTHNKIVIPRAPLSLAPAEESLDRFLSAYKLLGVENARVSAMFQNDPQMILEKRFNFEDCAGHYLFFRRYIGENYYSCSVPQTVFNDIMSQYQTINPKELEKKYRLDFWLWGPEETKWATVNPETDLSWVILWENDAYKIYRVKN